MSQVQLLPTEPLSPPVSLYNGRPATTSREVASFFGKRHDDVIKSIRNLWPNCPEKFTARNFAASEYTDETGRSLPLFILYRDGFMLLVMGYTGKRALAVKLAYIEAFNSLEARLAGDVKKLSSASLPEASTTLRKSTVDDREPIRQIVDTWAELAEKPHFLLYRQLRAAFQIKNIKELPAEWVPDAIAWVQEKIDSLQRTVPASPGTGSTQRRLPATRRPSHAPALPPLISGDELKFFDYVCNQARLGIRTYRKMVYDRGENLYTNILKDMLPGENNQARREALAKVFHHALWDMIDRMCWCSGDELQPEHNPAVAVKIFLDALSASAVTSNGRA